MAKVPEGFRQQDWDWIRAIGEKEWLSQLVEISGRTGWMRNHARNSIQIQKDGTRRHLTAVQGDTGYPDITFAYTGLDPRPVRFVMMEAKRWTERTSFKPKQVDWIIALRRAGIFAVVCTPADHFWLVDLFNGNEHEPLRRSSLFGPGTIACDPKLLLWRP